MNVKQITAATPRPQTVKNTAKNAAKLGATVVLAVIMDAKTKRAYETNPKFRERVDRFERTHDGEDVTLVATNEKPDRWADQCWDADVIAIVKNGLGDVVSADKIDSISV